MENMSRQELLDFIKYKEKELDDLRTASANGEPVDIGEMSRIEDEIKDAENELEKLAELEGEYDSGVNLDNALKKHEEYQHDELDEVKIDMKQHNMEQDKGEYTLTLNE